MLLECYEYNVYINSLYMYVVEETLLFINNILKVEEKLPLFTSILLQEIRFTS